MRIQERVRLYKKLIPDCRAVEPVKEFIQSGVKVDKLEELEAIRGLNTTLADLYMIEIPVITCWVRDDSYVPETREIYLTEPELKAFLHQWRHHLQNVERKYERRGLTMEGKQEHSKVPYEDTIYKLYGEDDAVAWSEFVVDMAKK